MCVWLHLVDVNITKHWLMKKGECKLKSGKCGKCGKTRCKRQSTSLFVFAHDSFPLPCLCLAFALPLPCLAFALPCSLLFILLSFYPFILLSFYHPIDCHCTLCNYLIYNNIINIFQKKGVAEN